MFYHYKFSPILIPSRFHDFHSSVPFEAVEEATQKKKTRKLTLFMSQAFSTQLRFSFGIDQENNSCFKVWLFMG